MAHKRIRTSGNTPIPCAHLLRAGETLTPRCYDSVKVRSLHFVHQRSSNDHAMPLIMTHGWPGSVTEFSKITPMLTEPQMFGGNAEDAFHLICPSIPGYGFSEPPTEPDFDQKQVAQGHLELMQRLGYSRFGAQGGDWGSPISSWTAALAEGAGYQAIQGTRPQTLGYGLNDSPAGLAAWTDCGGNIESSISKDDLLTNIMVYWVNACITSSMRLYYESAHADNNLFERGRIATPTGCAMFPGELYQPPRAWAEELYNIQHWTRMSAGGHFAALEQPELLAQDLREFFRQLR
ncbi:MAG: alpha/beta fold hydrolase [Pseudomonadales bacterium]